MKRQRESDDADPKNKPLPGSPSETAAATIPGVPPYRVGILPSSLDALKKAAQAVAQPPPPTGESLAAVVARKRTRVEDPTTVEDVQTEAAKYIALVEQFQNLANEKESLEETVKTLQENTARLSAKVEQQNDLLKQTANQAGVLQEQVTRGEARHKELQTVIDSLQKQESTVAENLETTQTRANDFLSSFIGAYEGFITTMIALLQQAQISPAFAQLRGIVFRLLLNMTRAWTDDGLNLASVTSSEETLLKYAATFAPSLDRLDSALRTEGEKLNDLVAKSSDVVDVISSFDLPADMLSALTTLHKQLVSHIIEYKTTLTSLPDKLQGGASDFLQAMKKSSSFVDVGVKQAQRIPGHSVDQLWSFILAQNTTGTGTTHAIPMRALALAAYWQANNKAAGNLAEYMTGNDGAKPDMLKLLDERYRLGPEGAAASSSSAPSEST